MKIRHIILHAIFVIFSLTNILCEENNENIELIESTEHFNKHISVHENTLIMFFAPWCGHCKRLHPKFDKAGETLLKEDNIKLGKVDCTDSDSKKLCERFNVNGYPTLKFFKKSVASDYEGGRESEDIITYVRARTGPSITILKTEQEFESFKRKFKIYLVEFSDKTSDFFQKSSENFVADIGFAHVQTQKLADSISKDFNSDSILLFRDFDEPEIEYSDSKTEKMLNKWISDNRLPILGEVGPQNFKFYVEKKLPILWIAVDPNKKETPSFLDDLRVVLKDFKDEVVALYVDAIKFSSHIDNIGLSKQIPGIIIIESKSNKKFIHSETKITPNSLRQFLKDYVSNKLEPFYKSEKIPEKNDKALRIVVGKTFKEMVIENDNDVVLEFYSPNCPHCKSFEPEYNKLAELFEDNESVVIAKINGVSNETPVSIKGFPTVYLFRNGQKDKPLLYEGERNAQAMEKWIMKHATKLQTKKHEEL